MIIHFAGSVAIAERENRLIRLNTPRLFSFYYISTNLFNDKKMFDMCKNKVELFLDSGAFSAHTQGININLLEYIAFIKENIEYIHTYANLDVIGNPEETWKNQLRMEKAGLTPLPCFHYGDDEKWLKKYLDRGYSYIALGGMVKTPNLIPWLDRIFLKYLLTPQKTPAVKVHGFGLTSVPLMLRYPWYSVDSTSWVMCGRMGGIFMPMWRNGKWDYSENSWKISVSSNSLDLKIPNAHVLTLPTKQRQLVLQYIESKGYKLGTSISEYRNNNYILQQNEKWAEKKHKDTKIKRKIEIITEVGISNTYQLRDEMNVLYFMDLEKNMPEWNSSRLCSNNLNPLF